MNERFLVGVGEPSGMTSESCDGMSRVLGAVGVDSSVWMSVNVRLGIGVGSGSGMWKSVSDERVSASMYVSLLIHHGRWALLLIIAFRYPHTFHCNNIGHTSL